MPQSPERTWSPNILAPVESTQELMGSYRFLRAVAMPQGSVHILGIHPLGHDEQVIDLEKLAQAFIDDEVWSRSTLVEETNFINGTRTAMEVLSSVFFRPNILFLSVLEDDYSYDLAQLLARTAAYQMGVVLLARNNTVELGREQHINVWMREQAPEWKLGLRLANLDLAVLLAVQLRRNWNGRINLVMIVSDNDMENHARHFLQELIILARLERNTQITVVQGKFWDALTQVPAADINIFGLQAQPNLEFVEQVVDTLGASCIFVRDSGDESALA